MPRILIIKPSSLGDIATAMPMLCDLHAAMPDARIDWVIAPGLAALLEGHAGIHGLIPFERKTLGRWYTPGGMTALRDLRMALRGGGYDVVIDAQGLLRSGVMTRITKAPMRIGFAHAREGAARAYTHKVSLPGDGKKMLSVDRMRALLGPLGVRAGASPVGDIVIQPAALAAIDALLGTMSPPTILIPGARWETKRWSVEGFTELGRRILEGGDSLVLAGSPDEKLLCDQIERSLQSKIEIQKSKINLVNLAGKTPLPQLIALLSRARLVIGNDSGPLHVAVALGRPVVAAYGPTDPMFVGPAGQMDRVVRFDVPCFPCRLKMCDHHSCMRGVTVEMMWEKAKSG